MIEAAGSINAEIRHMRRYVPIQEPLTFLDWVLLKEVPLKSMTEWNQALPAGTQLDMFHSCVHCCHGVSTDVPQRCNYCGRWLTRFMVMREVWLHRLRRVGTFLWVFNTTLKESHREAIETLGSTLARAVDVSTFPVRKKRRRPSPPS